jgi:hypothetical protein
MRFQSAEDRLNPITPEGVTDTTLEGYQAVHGRAVAFEGRDGEPYTAGVEAEAAEDGEGWVAYLVFPRWAQTGSAVMGHIETGDLERRATEEEARAAVGAYPLSRIREILDAEIARRQAEQEEG